MNEPIPILSIIIPSYNTSKYVDECLPTFIDERLFGKVKILLIDDGATDDTASKIKPYVDKYPQLFEFHHKENGGHGSVINYGVHKLVKTKYFKVVDGDDWVITENLVDLVDYLYGTDDDLIVSSYYRVYPKKQVLIEATKKRKEALPERVSMDVSTICGSNASIHSITYKTSIFVDNKISLPEKVFYEDNLYVMYPLVYVRTISYTGKPVYCYRLGNPNQSVSSASFLKHYNDAIKIRELAHEFYKTAEGKVSEGALRFIVGAIASGTTVYRSVAECFPANRETKDLLMKHYHEDEKIPLLISTLKRSKYFRFLSFFRFSPISLRLYRRHIARVKDR